MEAPHRAAERLGDPRGGAVAVAPAVLVRRSARRTTACMRCSTRASCSARCSSGGQCLGPRHAPRRAPRSCRCSPRCCTPARSARCSRYRLPPGTRPTRRRPRLWMDAPGGPATRWARDVGTHGPHLLRGRAVAGGPLDWSRAGFEESAGRGPSPAPSSCKPGRRAQHSPMRWRRHEHGTSHDRAGRRPSADDPRRPAVGGHR
jgi:hypothetical protein